jgi:SAM-dependent methyltransferase
MDREGREERSGRVNQTDRSSGYEAIAQEFLARRGRGSTRSNAIGVKEARAWARSLPRGANVLDAGCGPGFPITVVLVEEGLQVFGVDGSPSFVAAFRQNLPGVPILCEPVQDSSFFHRTFDAALAMGLIFLLPVDHQHRLIRKFAEILVPRGRLLLTVTDKPNVWLDAMTGLESVSLGAEGYTRLLADAGFSIASPYEDAGGNRYLDAFRS